MLLVSYSYFLTVFLVFRGLNLVFKKRKCPGTPITILLRKAVVSRAMPFVDQTNLHFGDEFEFIENCE